MQNKKWRSYEYGVALIIPRQCPLTTEEPTSGKCGRRTAQSPKYPMLHYAPMSENPDEAVTRRLLIRLPLDGFGRFVCKFIYLKGAV